VSFSGWWLPEAPPDHSTISLTRRLIDLETHEAVFSWMLQRLADAGLVKGKTVGIDATTLEANAALRSIVQDFLTKLAQASGIETPTCAPVGVHIAGPSRTCHPRSRANTRVAQYLDPTWRDPVTTRSRAIVPRYGMGLVTYITGDFGGHTFRGVDMEKAIQAFAQSRTGQGSS
jgi:hypothetical protein